MIGVFKPVQYDIKFFGWYDGVTKKGNQSDKVWGWVIIANKYYTFWGKREGKLQFKRERGLEGFGSTNFHTERQLQRAADCKAATGYKIISVHRNEDDGVFPEIEKIKPGFSSSFKRELFNARMFGKIRDED